MQPKALELYPTYVNNPNKSVNNSNKSKNLLMKIALSFLMLLILSFAAVAQQQETKDPITGKFYVGVNYNTTPYYLKYKGSDYASSKIQIDYKAYPSVHLGYMLSKRASIQIGAAYASTNYQGGSEYNNTSIIEGDYDTIQTRGFVIPATFRYNILNVNKRLQVFGTSSLTTAYGKTTLEHTSTINGVVTDNYKLDKSTVNVYLSLGLGINYKISDRFHVYGEYILLNKNLNNAFSPNKHNFNIGLNYKFK